MRIKRYFGKTIRETIQKVRAEQGPDAVILSNRKVDGGIEIIAAIDFDEVILAADAPDLSGHARSAYGSPPSPAGGRGHEGEGAHGSRLPTADSRLSPQDPAPRGLINRRREPTGLPRAIETPAPISGATGESAANVAEAAKSNEPDPGIVEMRRELKSLRGILEQQLSGLVWGDVARRNPITANLMRLLLKMEVSPRLCRDIAAEIGGAPARATGANDAQTLWRNALASLAHKLPVTDDDILTRGGVVALLGPTGVGKTTTIAKLAARYAVRHGARHVALVTTDNYRIGAVEQLRAYARILDVPMRVVSDAAELKTALRDFSEKRLVLIDTAGMSQRDLRLTEQFSLIRAGGEVLKSYLVLSATTRPSGADEIIRTYRRIPLAGCILTKVDEAGSLGGVLSLLIRHELAVAYVSDGQRVPEDLYAARAHRLVSRSVAMMRRESVLGEDESFAMAMGGGVVHA
jgi:flagellar biosynthesis protein FlhF